MGVRGGMLLALAMIEPAYREPGTRLELRHGDGSGRVAVVTRLPMEEP